MEQEHKQVIQELVDLLNQNHLSEIEYEISGLHLRVVGTGVKTPVSQVVPTEQPEIKTTQKTINSPMVGVAYLSSDVNVAPFVKVGDMVSVGQVVCQIEAMKTFNPIKADKAGRITHILIESGSPVEYNQPLFVLE